MNAALFALGSAFLGGATPVLLRLRTHRFPIPILNALKLTGGLLVLTPLLLWVRPSLEGLSPATLALVFLTALLGPVTAWSSYIRAIRETDVSIAHPVINSYPALSILLDLWVYGVRPSSRALLSFFVLLLGITFLTRSSQKGQRSLRGLPFAFLTAFLWGLNSFLFKVILQGLSPWWMTYLRVLMAAPLMWLLALHRAGGKDALRGVSVRDLLPPLLAGGINDGAGMFLFFWAVQIGPLYLALPLASTSPFFSGLLSAWVLREPLTPQRWAGIALVVAGIITLTLSR